MNWFKKIEIKPKVLVIDNFPIERHQVRDALRDIGYGDVIEAENTDAIKHYIRTESIGLVVLNWNMPKLDVLKTLKFICSSRPIVNIPVIVMGDASTSQADIVTAIKSGADNYLVRPFTNEILAEKVLQVLKKQNK
jgi:two-component system, chemotaxis family, chemotaxis protein CheY